MKSFSFGKNDGAGIEILQIERVEIEVVDEKTKKKLIAKKKKRQKKRQKRTQREK